MRLICKTILLWAACALIARADKTIVLVNGDRLSGEVIKVESGTLFLRSKLLGEIKVAVTSVKSGLEKPTAGATAAAAVTAPATVAGNASAPAPDAAKPAGAPDRPADVAQSGDRPGGDEKPGAGAAKSTSAPAVAKSAEKKAEPFDFRVALHIPDKLTGDVKVSAYRREREYLEDLIYLQPRFKWKDDTHSFEWNFYYRYRRNNNTTGDVWQKKDDRMTAEQKYRYNFDKTVFAQSRTYWEKDRVKEIDPRIIQSLGLGLYVLRSKTLSLDFSPGIGYEYADYSDEEDASITPTFEQNLEWTINSHFSFEQSFSWTGMQDEYQYDFTSELEAKVSKNFSVVFEYTMEYDQQVEDNEVTDSRDARTTGSVRVKF